MQFNASGTLLVSGAGRERASFTEGWVGGTAGRWSAHAFSCIFLHFQDFLPTQGLIIPCLGIVSRPHREALCVSSIPVTFGSVTEISQMRKSTEVDKLWLKLH